MVGQVEESGNGCGELILMNRSPVGDKASPGEE